MPKAIDEIDRRLIEALRGDGRRSNKSLAGELGIAETTVASRIRQLQDDGVMLVTLRRDLYSLGYDLQCFADVYVEGREVEQVAADFAAIDIVSSVSILAGSPEVLVVFNARDRSDLMRVLTQRIAAVAGVKRVDLQTAVDIRKYQTGSGILRQPPLRAR